MRVSYFMFSVFSLSYSLAINCLERLVSKGPVECCVECDSKPYILTHSLTHSLPHSHHISFTILCGPIWLLLEIFLFVILLYYKSGIKYLFLAGAIGTAHNKLYVYCEILSVVW